MLIWGVFVACFLSATVLPFSSEVVFVGALSADKQQVWLLLLVASIGNTLGSLTGYALGRMAKFNWLERYFKISEEKLASQQVRIQKYGSCLAFFCWLPFVGDLLAVALGFFRARFWPCTAFMFLGKFLRYAVLCLLFFRVF